MGNHAGRVEKGPRATRHQGLPERGFRHCPAGPPEIPFDAPHRDGVGLQLPAGQPGHRVEGPVVRGRPEPAEHEHQSRADERVLNGAGDIFRPVGHHRPPGRNDAEVTEPATDERGVGVDRPAGKQFVTDHDQFGAGNRGRLHIRK